MIKNLFREYVELMAGASHHQLHHSAGELDLYQLKYQHVDAPPYPNKYIKQNIPEQNIPAYVDSYQLK